MLRSVPINELEQKTEKEANTVKDKGDHHKCGCLYQG